MTSPTGRLTELQGLSGAPGIALGRAYHIDRPHIRVPHHKIEASGVEHELQRLNSSLALSRHQLTEAKAKLDLEEHAQILDAHLSLFKDPELIGRFRRRIEELLVNSEWAVTQVIAEVTSIFDHVEDPYLRERRRDFEYVERRLLHNLMGVKQQSLEDITEPVILVAHDLSPADLAHINRDSILGIVTDVGGATSHTAILARAMELPTAIGLERVTEYVKTGDLIILDGFEGKVFLNPSLELIADYETRRQYHEQFEEGLRQIRDLPTQTSDGHAVVLAANIELPSELDTVLSNGLTQIGLFRTEFLFLFSSHTPTEEEQFEVYRNVVQRLGDGGVTTIRTIDLGGDKVDFAEEYFQQEANPAMGLRAIRLCLAYPDIFRVQLRAILRASAFGKVRIMFPMISGLEEMRIAKRIVAEVADELRTDGIAFDENIQTGIMIETPAAAAVADLLAPEADFFSIGTNDLIQYTLAVDRGNEHVNYLFHPLHPAVLRAVRRVVECGHEQGIPVAVCGEMAGEPAFVKVLLGLGVDELSMSPNRALRIKRLIARFSREEARQLAQEALKLPTVAQINDLILSHMHTHYREDFELDDADGYN
ncbi:MAG: phosphoenolpyruvate--protein phosphotransferase [Candidatus Lernaella stagnicola]|nr:phosphoenolpyruvate--protein phosphotransferase [Candidatus Lernaella stagnicola]